MSLPSLPMTIATSISSTTPGRPLPDRDRVARALDVVGHLGEEHRDRVGAEARVALVGVVAAGDGEELAGVRDRREEPDVGSSGVCRRLRGRVRRSRRPPALPRRRNAFMSPPDSRPPDAASRSWTWSFSRTPTRAGLPSASYRTSRIAVPPLRRGVLLVGASHASGPSVECSHRALRTLAAAREGGGGGRATGSPDPAGLLQRVRGLGAGTRGAPRRRDLPDGGAHRLRFGLVRRARDVEMGRRVDRIRLLHDRDGGRGRRAPRRDRLRHRQHDISQSSTDCQNRVDARRRL